jgi:hypothetical protein
LILRYCGIAQPPLIVTAQREQDLQQIPKHQGHAGKQRK